ncbi:MAG TPA: leucyl/phenylalanyl-tRNA--protein transferase, partial [Caldimonas sp.]
MIPWLQSENDPLPRTQLALSGETEAPGLLAAGGTLTPRRLEEAYSHGVFPWYSQGQPVLWWSPDPRMVLLVDEFKLSRSLRKTLARFVRTAG